MFRVSVGFPCFFLSLLLMPFSRKFIRKKASKVVSPLFVLIGDYYSLLRDPQTPALTLARTSI